MPETEKPRISFRQFAERNALMQIIDYSDDIGLTQFKSIKLLTSQAIVHEDDLFSITVSTLAGIIAPLVEEQAGKPVEPGYITACAREFLEDYSRFTGNEGLAAKVQAARQNLAPEAAGSKPSNVVEIGARRQN